MGGLWFVFKRVFPNKKKSNGFNFVSIFVHAAYPPLSNLYYKLYIPQDLPPEGAKNHTQELDQGDVCSLIIMYLCCRSLLLKLVKSEEPSSCEFALVFWAMHCCATGLKVKGWGWRGGEIPSLYCFIYSRLHWMWCKKTGRQWQTQFLQQHLKLYFSFVHKR